MQKPIKIKLSIQGGKGGVIQRGLTETLLIEVVDELASFHFTNDTITKAFSKRQNEDGVQTVYNERLHKCLSKYPGLMQKELVNHLTTRIKELEKQHGE